MLGLSAEGGQPPHVGCYATRTAKPSGRSCGHVRAPISITERGRIADGLPAGGG